MLLRHDVFRRLCRARDMLEDVPEDPVSIEDVAREVGISPFHFIRQFEAVFGLTPHQFRIQSRLDRAKHLLAMGGHSVTDVCMEVGFSSLGSFSDLFTRRVGATPSAYQRRRARDGAGARDAPPGSDPRLPQPDDVPAGVGVSQFSRSAGGVLLPDSGAVIQHPELIPDSRREGLRCGSSSPASWSTIRTRR